MSDNNPNQSLLQVLLPDEHPHYVRGTLDDVKCIAKGGMAHIFRARQPSLDRYVVVKKLKDELMANPETIERFRREAKALASVLHHNVAHVYDFVEGGRESYIVMEYIEGIDLSTMIEKVGHLPPEIATALLLNVARGVSYIHAHNLIHRDIKPSNIRVTSRGNVKLMDFGIVMDIDNLGLTRPGMMVGSPSYLSPEQVLGDSITPSADIFLLGIVLYEMLTGSRPFKEENGQTIFQRIREAQYVPAKLMQPKIPSALDRVIRRCLQKNPQDRYANIKELISALEKFLGPTKTSHSEDLLLKFLDEEALLTPSVAYHPILENDRKWRELLNWRVGLVATGLLIAAFAAGYFAAPRKFSAASHVASPLPPPKPLERSRK